MATDHKNRAGVRALKKVKSFQLLQKCQKLSATLLNVTSNAPKNYRASVVDEVINESYSLIHVVQNANQSRLYSKQRNIGQEEAKKHLEHIIDLLPVLRICRLISPAQEEAIESAIYYVQTALAVWVESDYSRIAEQAESICNVLLENTKKAAGACERIDYKIDLKKELSLLSNIQTTMFSDDRSQDFARICCYIADQNFSCNDFFLMNYNPDVGRFTFSNSSWTKFFCISYKEEDLQPHPQYRDEKKQYYTAENILTAIDCYYYKRKTK